MTDDKFKDAMENSEIILSAGKGLAVIKAAREAGRTVEEEQARMGDRFAYSAVEKDESQQQ